MGLRSIEKLVLDYLTDLFYKLDIDKQKSIKIIFASAVGGMQNSYFFMGLRSLKKIGDLTILLIYYRPLS